MRSQEKTSTAVGETAQESVASDGELAAGYQSLLDRAVEALPVASTKARALPIHAVSGSGSDFDDIPEAVPLDRIPTASKKQVPLAKGSAALGNRVRRVKSLPQKRQLPTEDIIAKAEPARPIDTSKFVRIDEFREGNYRVKPLERVPGEFADSAPVPRPKFLDGELPRSLERGLKHPQPTMVRITAVLLLLAKVLLLATIIVGPIAAIQGREEFIKVVWIPISFFVVGLLFLLFARKCRCRVCSCHFFFVKRCFKHRSAHRVWFLGYAGSAALHVLMFRWMRCMYCGTAIRMRVPKGEENNHT